MPAQVLPLLADLALARDITTRFLRRMDLVADAMAPDDLAQALAHDSTLTLNVARADRALRQIVAMELEVMGLREPAVPRTPGPGGAGPAGAGGGERHDFNDINDLNDLDDLKDEFEALFDLSNPEDRRAFADLESLEACDSFEKYSRQHRRAAPPEPVDNSDMIGRIRAEVERIRAAEPEELTPEERHRRMKEMREMEQGWAAEGQAAMQDKWQKRRALLLRRRALEKRLARRGRGPPAG